MYFLGNDAYTRIKTEEQHSQMNNNEPPGRDESCDEDVFVGDMTDNISLQINDFGCHLEWTELQKIDGLTLTKFKEVLRGETWVYTDRPTYFTAVRNLQGFIEYKLGEEENAEEFFLEVLENDPVNINALGNMVHMLRLQYRLQESGIYEDRLRAIFEKTHDHGGYCQSYPQRALAYADRAHAIRYFEQDKRCFRYMIYVERAATLGRYCRDSTQRAEWFFDHALALYRRDVQMLYLKKISDSPVSEVMERKIKSGYEKAIRLFYDVINISNSTAYLSLSWVFIGIMLNHDPGNRHLARIFPNLPEVGNMSADDCYKKGLSINDTHEITTRRVGAEYVKLRRYGEAKKLLDRSISILTSWFAHRYLGVLYLYLYEDETLTDSYLLTRFSITVRTELLNMAKAEFEKAQKERIVHADHSDLGQVHFLLGEWKQAKAKFKRACDCKQDDYFDVLETYRRWIRCVGDGNPDEVTSLRNKAETHRKNLLDTPLDTNGDSFSDDFEHYSTSALPGHVRLLTEADFWVASATGRTRHNPMPHRGPIPTGQYTFDFFLSFNERDRIWSLALLNKLETEYKLRGCIEQRDFLVGDDRVNTIKRCLRDSYRSIVVLSPHYAGSRDSKSIVREAVRVGFKRVQNDGRYILPILLTDCEIHTLDDELTDVMKIVCDKGQIPVHHWDNLVSTLRQEND